MKSGIRILAEILDAIGLQLVDVHIMLNKISDLRIVSNLEICLIAYFGMVRKVLLAILVYSPTIRLTTVVKQCIFISFTRVDAGYKTITIFPIPIGKNPLTLLAMFC